MKKLLLSLSLLTVGYISNAQFVEQATGFPTQSRGIEDIKIIDANTVWGLAYDGSGAGDNVQEFTRTIDGGATWTPGVIDLGDPALKIGNLVAIDADTAWVSYFVDQTGQGGVAKTTDGGQSWNMQTSGYFIGATSWCDGVHFFDANNGIAWGDPESTTTTHLEFYRTTDGGDTWSTLPAFNSAAFTSGDFAYAGSYAYSGNTIWIPTAKGKIYRSNDQGLTWTRINSPIADFGGGITTTSAGSLYFSDANNGILIGRTLNTTTTPVSVSGRKIYRTTNGGTTWSPFVTYTSQYNGTISYIPGTTILVGTGTIGTGTSAVSYTGYSTDNAATWTDYDSGIQRTSIAFLNENLGWAGGFNASDIQGGIFRFDGTLANQLFSTNTFKVYPNPANASVTISSKQGDAYSLKVTDITGKTMLTKEYSSVENNVDISNLASGLYFFEFKSGSKSETIKIMKK